MENKEYKLRTLVLQKCHWWVPQGSTDKPLLFNLFNQIKDTLAKDYRMVTNWFYENVMVLNSKKCHLICTGKDLENETFTFEGAC